MKPNLSRLTTILGIMRPSKSVEENQFVRGWLNQTIRNMLLNPEMDLYGNVWVTVGDNPTTMFSSHTDTVHDIGGKQKLEYDNALYHLFPANKKESGCLGADDGTGIWLMLHMMESKIPGLYAFHRDEECGGGGSVHGAAKERDRLKNIKHCVAFDRKGYTDIITHQGGTRTCSDAFATELAKYLPGFSPCDGGSFTDSKNYRGVIPECTNLAVGYFNQHGPSEYQDVKFAVQLANQLCKVPWDKLPTVRTAEIEARSVPAFTRAEYKDMWGGYDTALTMNELNAWVRKHPMSAAYLLESLMVTSHDLLDAEADIAAYHRQMVLQRTDDVRTLPTGGKKEVPGQATKQGKRGDEPRPANAQSSRAVHNGGKKPATKRTTQPSTNP